MVRVGIIGPSSTVDMVLQIAKEYIDYLIVIPFIYNKPEDTTFIIQEKQLEVDIWMLAGPVLYPFVKESGSHHPFFFLQLDSASLTKTLVEAGYKDQLSLQKMSIDILSSRDVYETFQDLGLPHESLYSKEFQEDIPINELFIFHKNLFTEHKVDVCLTCLYAIYEQLQAENIPSYWIRPTRTNVRETITKIIQYWETKYFKESQISVILIKVNETEKNNNLTLSYDQHRFHLQLQSAIINFSESISGSFVHLGTGTFIIFSTRGSVQNAKTHVINLLEKTALITDLSMNIGIGYGDTALVAEEKARIALQNAQNYDKYCAFLVDDNGMIEGPLHEEEKISYGYRNENKKLSETLKQCGVTIKTFNKILSVQKRTDNYSVNASVLAEWLKMTPRNARRILNNLVEHGIAEVIGEEAPSSKGRPRNIYRVKLDS